MAREIQGIQRARHIATLLSRAGTVEVLWYLDEHDEARAKDLLSLGGSEASVVRRLRDLTDAGLIERRVFEDRTTRYALTAQGRDAATILKKMAAIEDA